MAHLLRGALAPIAALTVVACGGKGGGAKAPAAVDVCAHGVHAAGMTARAATWDALVMVAGATAADACDRSPCDPDAPVSFVGRGPDEQLAVKLADGWLALGDVWDAGDAVPTATLTPLGELWWLSVYAELTGRDEVTLDDGETTTATVITGQTYHDFLIDPAAGKVLWRAVCGGEGDEFRPTAVTRDGERFGYVGCDGASAPIGFTAAEAAACPSYGAP